MSRYRLSIIIIAYNEEETIADTISSGMKAASKASEILESYEIILVDDNSSDKTVDIASRFPITILQHDRQHGPSAARYTGYKHTSPNSEFILYLDGDVTIYDNWLSLAIRYLLKKPNVAGVGGRIQRTYEKLAHSSFNINPVDKLQGSPHVRLRGGLSLYKKKVLDQVGSFDPWVLGEEERELGFRIRQKNYELHWLNIDVAQEFTKKSKTSVFRRVGFNLGVGQLIARELHRRTSLASELFKHYKNYFLFFGWVVSCIPVAILSLLGFFHPLLWKAIVILNVLGYLAVALMRGGLLKAAKILVTAIIECSAILVGLFKKQDTTCLPDPKLLKKSGSIAT